MTRQTDTHQITHLSHAQLVQIAYGWVLRRSPCKVAVKELNTHCCNGEYPDVIGFSSRGHSVLIEVKASRSDFLSDKKKSFRKLPEKGMGDYRFYCCPTGLIKVEDLPDKWGLIYVDPKGRPRCVHNPYCRSLSGNTWSKEMRKNSQAEIGLMFSALRRLDIKGHLDSIYDKSYNYTNKRKYK